MNPGELVMQLTALNARAVAAYDFSGTGTGAANDANPHAYQVDTSVLSLGGINIGDPLRVRGFVAPYGSAPLDFIASSVIDLSQVNAHMSLRWVPAESAVLSVIDNDQLVFDLSGSERARVRRHEYVLDLPSSVPVTIAAPSDDAGLYAMQKRGAGTQVFRSFARFSEALTSEITASNKVSQVMAKGSYHDANSVLQADHVHIKLK